MNLIKGFIQKYLNIIALIIFGLLSGYIGYLKIDIYAKDKKITNLNTEINNITLKNDRLIFELGQANLSIDKQNTAIAELEIQTKALDNKLKNVLIVNASLDEKLQAKLKEKAPKECSAAFNWLREQAGKL